MALAELEVSHRHTLTDEFAFRVVLQTRELDNSLPLKSLLARHYKDSSGILSKPFPPELINWFIFYYSLQPEEKIGLTKCLGAAAWGFETIGELREASLEEVQNRMSRNGFPIRGMGERTAAFLKEIFEVPVPVTAS